MSQKFTVDAVIPTWNGAAFLEEAVYSVLSQTYLPAQLIIIDDGSTDNTAALIEKIKLENKGPVTILYHFQQNSGLSAARNKGIALSSAPLIAFLDADDAWHPTKLEKQTELFMHPAFPDLALVYCAYDVMDELSCRQSSAYVTHIRKELQGNVFDLLTTANYISGSGSGVLIRKSCLEKTGGFDTKLGAYEDWDMWLRIAETHAIDYVEEVLLSIRRHSSNMQANQSLMNENVLLFYKKWLPRISNRESIRYWAFAIANLVLYPVYKPEMKKRIETMFSKAELRKLYYRTAGSFELYLMLKRIRIALKGSR